VSAVRRLGHHDLAGQRRHLGDNLGLLRTRGHEQVVPARHLLAHVSLLRVLMVRAVGRPKIRGAFDGGPALLDSTYSG